MSNMPLMIDLQNKKIVIVGGGKVATRRAKSLVEYCSHVHIVSPSITKELHTLFAIVKKCLNHKILVTHF